MFINDQGQLTEELIPLPSVNFKVVIRNFDEWGISEIKDIKPFVTKLEADKFTFEFNLKHKIDLEGSYLQAEKMY